MSFEIDAAREMVLPAEQRVNEVVGVGEIEQRQRSQREAGRGATVLVLPLCQHLKQRFCRRCLQDLIDGFVGDRRHCGEGRSVAAPMLRAKKRLQFALHPRAQETLRSALRKSG